LAGLRTHIAPRNRLPSFHPFARRTSDGREYTVRHPEMILVAPRSLGVVDRNGEIVTLDGLHIVAIKNLRGRTNGASKRWTTRDRREACGVRPACWRCWMGLREKVILPE
jgi:hypothetical protein